MTPPTFVTWKWTTPGYRSTFGPDQVNTLQRSIARHYDAPHRFCCVTDDAEGLDPAVEVIPDRHDFASLPSPSGGRNPSCYRRLRAFSPEFGAEYGRIVSLDLDIVITGNLRSLFDREDDFIIWGDTNPRTFYNCSLFMLRPGARTQVWTTFDPVASPAAAKAAGHFGSDQGWVSHCLGPHERKWSTADGVYSYQNHLRDAKTLPADARIVVFHGHQDPWSPAIYHRVSWVREHYR